MENNRQNRSRPSAGKTMVGLLKEFGKEFHNANEQLAQEISTNRSIQRVSNWKEQILAFKFFDSDLELLEGHKSRLISSTLLSNLICSVVTKHLPSNTTVSEAEKWFHPDQQDTFSRYISPQVQFNISSKLNEILPRISMDMLPYLFEIFETGQETAEAIGSNRVKKKDNGIYYTPSDVIEFIVSRCALKSKKKTNLSSWYDPAVGTGAFLLGVVRQHFREEEIDEDFLGTCLFGTDISPFALQSTAYLIMSTCLKSSRIKQHPRYIWQTVGRNLALCDATKIFSKEILRNIFPNVGIQGFDFIISNPPYSKRKNRQLDIFANDDNEIVSEEIYPDFVRMLFELTSEDGSGGMVVPLSITCNSKPKFRTLRKFIQSKSGVAEFWNFDRTPDSLFGDDVKTRNTIIIYHDDRSQPALDVQSTYLHRWNSRNRQNLFKSISATPLNYKFELANGIPKVGDEMGSNLLSHFQEIRGSLAEIIRPSSQGSSDLAIKSTAYNWIPIELNPSTTSSIGKTFWSVQDSNVSSEMIYATLNGRLTYWVWRAWSDGFHLNNNLINELPFGNDFFQKVDKYRLNQLGQELWESIQSEKIVTRNAGVESYSYCPLKFEELISQIDRIIFDVFEIPIDYVQYLKNHINSLIYAGRELEQSISKKIKYLELTQA